MSTQSKYRRQSWTTANLAKLRLSTNSFNLDLNSSASRVTFQAFEALAKTSPARNEKALPGSKLCVSLCPGGSTWPIWPHGTYGSRNESCLCQHALIRHQAASGCLLLLNPRSLLKLWHRSVYRKLSSKHLKTPSNQFAAYGCVWK